MYPNNYMSPIDSNIGNMCAFDFPKGISKVKRVESHMQGWFSIIMNESVTFVAPDMETYVEYKIDQVLAVSEQKSEDG